MSYLSQSRRTSPASMAAVAAIHAGVGVLLVTGLTVSGTFKDRDILQVWDLKDPPPPPPPPEVEPQPQTDAATLPPLNVPKPPVDLNTAEPTQKTTDEVLPPLPPMPIPSASGTGTTPADPLPKPPRFDPVKAKPKNNPGAWLSDADYRPAWMRQEMTGTARFRLEIAANGRVTGCQVTGSTGHTPLDDATCALVSKRARFEPARDGNGDAVAGTYAGSVLWRLPE